MPGLSERGLETLAQWLTLLRAGDPCPCCGEPLHDDPHAPKKDGESERPALVCDRCGCVLEPSDASPCRQVTGAYELAA